MDTLSILLNFIVRIQSPDKLNHLLKITLQISSRSSSQLADHCLCICHLQLITYTLKAGPFIFPNLQYFGQGQEYSICSTNE